MVDCLSPKGNGWRKMRTSRSLSNPLLFIAITFAFSWTLWAIGEFAPMATAWQKALNGAAGLSPALAAVLVRRRDPDPGRPHLKAHRDALRFCALALAIPPLSYLVAYSMARIFDPGNNTLASSAYEFREIHLFIAVTLVGLLPALAEEYGWRGYLQRSIALSHPIVAACIVGTIWGIWHFPLVYSNEAYTSHRPLILLFYVLMNIPLSLLLGWLTVQTGSLIPATIGHASFNATGFAGAPLALIIWESGTLLFLSGLVICLTPVFLRFRRSTCRSDE